MTYEEVEAKYEPLFRSLAKQTLKQYHHDSELDLADLLQEARIAAWECLGTYSRDRGEFGAYLKTCVRNALIDYSRRYLPHTTGDSWEWTRVYVSNRLPERAIEDSTELQLAIEELGSPYREVVTLTAEGYNGVEIAQRLGIRSQRVSELKLEALGRLRELLAS